MNQIKRVKHRWKRCFSKKIVPTNKLIFMKRKNILVVRIRKIQVKKFKVQESFKVEIRLFERNHLSRIHCKLAHL